MENRPVTELDLGGEVGIFGHEHTADRAFVLGADLMGFQVAGAGKRSSQNEGSKKQGYSLEKFVIHHGPPSAFVISSFFGAHGFVLYLGTCLHMPP